MRFFRRQNFGCHVPYRTAPPGLSHDLHARPWEPAMVVHNALGCIYLDGHAREVLIDERLLLPDEGVVYLSYTLARWLVTIPDEACIAGARVSISGRTRLYDAYAMHVPGCAGSILTVTLRPTGRHHQPVASVAGCSPDQSAANLMTDPNL